MVHLRGRGDVPSEHDRQRGQVVVEFAIVTAIFLPLALVAVQIVMLLTYQYSQQQSTGSLAVVAARNGTGAAFDAAVAAEASRISCEAPEAAISTPVPEIVVVGLRCTWHAPVYRDASWPVSTTASAAVVGSAPTPSPTPIASPS